MSGLIKTIILTIIFVAVIYFFMFSRIKRRKSRDIDSISDFHSKYVDRDSLEEYNAIKKTINSKSYSPYSGDSGNYERRDYITKYNSNEDYREK